VSRLSIRFFFIVTTFIVIHDTLYTILHYMGTYYCELWQLGFKMDNLDGHNMYYIRTNYCNPWQSKYTIKYYMKKYHCVETVLKSVFTVFRLLTDFVCLYNYEFWFSICKIVRSSVIVLLPLSNKANRRKRQIQHTNTRQLSFLAW
jgi:hypothetical protein